MKLKSLLPAIVFVAAGLQGFSMVPLQFRDACNTAPDGGGHLEFPIDESTRTYDDETGAIKYWGDPVFNADGSIDLQPIATMNTGLGMYFRTKKLGTYLDEPIPSEYVVFAYEYKSNTAIGDQVVFLHEHKNSFTATNGNVIEVTDEYKTCYQILNRTCTEDNNVEWGNNEKWTSDYFWVSWNDPNPKNPDFRITIKNLRLLTLAEAAAECTEGAAGPVKDAFSIVGDMTRDIDPEMDNAFVYVVNGGNPLLSTSVNLKPLPAANTTLRFEYKMQGENFAPNFFLVQGGALAAPTAGAAFEGVEDPYEADWTVYEVDLSTYFNDFNFAQNFGSGDFVFMHMINMPSDNAIWLRNVEWINPNAVEDPTPQPATKGIVIEFRDAANTAPDGGGHMDFPVVEGTRTFDDETGAIKYYGDPAFNEDGSIDLQSIPTMNTGLGIYFRTKKLGTFREEPIPSEYVVLAYDYKSNIASGDQVVFLHEHNNSVTTAQGNMLEVTDTYKTCYQILNRTCLLDNNLEWGNHDNWAKDYFWIGWNNNDVKTPDFRLTIKNIRLLTLEQAAEECKADVAGEIADALTPTNGDIVRDYDPDMEAYVFVRAENGANPIANTNSHLKSLPEGVKYLTFEYKMQGETFAPRIHAVKGGTFGQLVANTYGPNFEPVEDAYDADWKTYQFDATPFIESNAWAQTFGSNDCLWFQFTDMHNGDMLWIKNLRWTSEEVAVEAIEADAANGPVEYYNLQGVRVANPTNGLYIRRQGNKATKVLVK